MKLIRAVGFVNGADCPHAGQFLMSADFEAYEGRGFMTFTKDPARAMKFVDFRAAMIFWQTQSKTVPLRPYGDRGPNRPLTALTVEIEDAPWSSTPPEGKSKETDNG